MSPHAKVVLLPVAALLALFVAAGSASAAEACPNEAFRTGASANLPECRAYEMVSPLDKNGADIEIDGPIRAADDGGAVSYNAFANPLGGLSGPYRTQLLSRRGASGWTTEALTPPQDPSPEPSAIFASEYTGLAPDLSTRVLSSWAFEAFPGSLHMLNIFRNTDKAGYQLLSMPSEPLAPLPGGPLAAGTRTRFQGASGDYSHIVFGSNRPLTPDAPKVEDGVVNAYLYEWSEGGLRLINFLPDSEGGGPLLRSTYGRMALGHGSPEVPYLLYPGSDAVSADGSRVYFSTQPEVGSVETERKVFLREDPDGQGVLGPSTVAVGLSERTDCAGDVTCGGDGVADPDPEPVTRSVTFEMASRDGTTAFITSIEKLTDDATASPAGTTTADLYRWQADAPVGHRLTDLTTSDPEGAAVINDGDNQAGVVGGNQAGTLVYFMARGVLASGAVDGEPNLYIWQQGKGVAYVATLNGAGDTSVWSSELSNGEGPRFRDSRVTPDGQFLVFRSRAKLTAFENAGHAEIYRYAASTGNLICVSCNPLASVASADAFLKRKQLSTNVLPWLPRNVSADGSRVFFDSAEALVKADTNGKIDVYEWHDSELSLVSGGQSADDSTFLDASSEGDDVYFTTRQQLVGQDSDTIIDVYDARVDGGFATPTVTPDCSGDACQGSGPPSRSVPTAASVLFTGPSNANSKKPRCAKGKARRNGRCVKKKQKSKKHRANNNRRAGR